jgi:hypothetical protein
VVQAARIVNLEDEDREEREGPGERGRAEREELGAEDIKELRVERYYIEY